MSFRLKNAEKRKKEWFDKMYFYFREEEVHITDFEEQSITPMMYQQMRMNSFARDELPPKLTDEALIQVAEYYQSHCSKPKFPCSTYDEALIHKIVPELIKRLAAYNSTDNH